MESSPGTTVPTPTPEELIIAPRPEIQGGSEAQPLWQNSQGQWRDGYGSCKCGAEWVGHNLGHCVRCHRTFVGEAFDRHQRYDGTGSKTGCLDPMFCGLAGKEKPWGIVYARRRNGFNGR